MSEDFDAGGLADPGGIMRIGPPDGDNYTALAARAKSQCTCKRPRFALLVDHNEGALCPKCDLGERPEPRFEALREALRQVVATFRRGE